TGKNQHDCLSRKLKLSMQECGKRCSSSPFDNSLFAFEEQQNRLSNLRFTDRDNMIDIALRQQESAFTDPTDRDPVGDRTSRGRRCRCACGECRFPPWGAFSLDPNYAALKSAFL